MESELLLDSTFTFLLGGPPFFMISVVLIIGMTMKMVSSNLSLVITAAMAQMTVAFAVIPKLQLIDPHSFKICFDHSLTAFYLSANVYHVTCATTVVGETPDGSSELNNVFGLLCNAFGVGVAIISAHVMHLSWMCKMAAVTIPLSHTLCPLWGLGRKEGIIMWSASLMGFVVGYLIERAYRLFFLQHHEQMQLAEANRLADSRLNHVVKGLCGSAIGMLQALEYQLDEQRSLSGRKAELLIHQAREMMEEAASWCHKRQIFVQLEARTYVSVLSACDVCVQLKQMIGSDGDVAGAAIFARIDMSIFGLIVQEAVSNARKYRRAESRIRVFAELIAQTEMAAATEGREGGGDTSTVDAPSRGVVQQPPSPSLTSPPLPSTTPAATASAAASSDLALRVCIDNVNRHGQGLLTPDECKQAFERGTKLTGSTNVSDGLGLNTVAVAAAAVGGHAWLHSYRAGDSEAHTAFYFVIPAVEIANSTSPTAVANPSQGGGDRMSSLMEAGDLARGCERTANSESPTKGDLPEAIECESISSDGGEATGTDSADPSVTKSGTRGSGNELEATESSRGLRCLGVDDDKFSRAMQTVMFDVFLGADMKRSRCLGESLAETTVAVDVAMGMRDMWTLKPLEYPHAQVEVVFVDKNICYKETTVQGSDLCHQLYERGFRGVTCILTGSTEEEVADIARKPGVDMAFEKGANSKTIAACIRSKLQAKQLAALPARSSAEDAWVHAPVILGTIAC